MCIRDSSCTHQRQDIADPCTGVRVRYADLLEIVRQDLNAILSLTDEQVEAMVQEALKQFGSEDSIKARKLQKEQAEARLLTIDKVVAKLYTDNAEGRLDDERLQRMVGDLEKESAGLRSLLSEPEPVSYTHLDVYKRQTEMSSARTERPGHRICGATRRSSAF